MKTFLLIASILLSSVICSFAKKYVVIGNETKVYDQPSVNGYATKGMDNKEIVAKPGMVFRLESSKNGWDKVEYMTGMHAFVESKAAAVPSACAIPDASAYTVVNTGSAVTLTHDGTNYKLTDGKVEYNGKLNGNALIFSDVTGNVVYTAVVLDGKTYFYNYPSLGW